jgi:hypothetical protein
VTPTIVRDTRPEKIEIMFTTFCMISLLLSMYIAGFIFSYDFPLFYCI